MCVCYVQMKHVNVYVQMKRVCVYVQMKHVCVYVQMKHVCMYVQMKRVHVLSCDILFKIGYLESDLLHSKESQA